MKGRVRINRLHRPDQGQSPSSSWLDTLPGGIKGAVEVDCAGAVGLAVGGEAVSRVLVCCLSSCLESSCGSLRGPISRVGTGVLCCCDAGEDPHAKRKNVVEKEKKHDTLLVPLTTWTPLQVVLFQVSPQSCCHCCPSSRSALLVLLDNRCWCQLCCGTSVRSCGASSGPQTAALCRPRDAAAACAPLRCSCPGHG